MIPYLSDNFNINPKKTANFKHDKFLLSLLEEHKKKWYFTLKEGDYISNPPPFPSKKLK